MSRGLSNEFAAVAVSAANFMARPDFSRSVGPSQVFTSCKLTARCGSAGHAALHRPCGSARVLKTIALGWACRPAPPRNNHQPVVNTHIFCLKEATQSKIKLAARRDKYDK